MVKVQVVTMVLVLCMLGCVPGPRPQLKRLYEGLKEPITGLDVSGLKGRKVVIDPGHGGVFRGARGLHGTDEADVNLSVALYLAKLLEEAGADVALTRSTDTDFVGGDSLRLRDDLRARVEIANRIDPDILISLHHNADPGGDHGFNEIQVYYRFGDEGPSLDVAQAVAKHLVTNLGEEQNQVLPGNYYVLRNAVSPAVLCEPSFISNPKVEAKIRLAEKQRLEATAYFLGLVDYFSKDVPRVVSLGPLGRDRSGGPIAGSPFEIAFDTGAMIDASAVEVTLDAARLQPMRVAYNRFVASPEEPLRAGKHILRASGRAYSGNASREAVTEFEVRTEPADVSLEAYPPATTPPFPQKISALVRDRNGNPVADSTSVTFSWNGGAIDRAAFAGTACVFVGKEIPFEADKIAANCGGITAEISLSAQPRSQAAPTCVSGLVLDTESKPVEGALVEAMPRGGEGLVATTPPSATSDRDGFFVVSCGSPPEMLAISKRGFTQVTAQLGSAHFPEVQLSRFYGSLGRDIAVTVDPENDVDADVTSRTSGLTASRLNLEVARRLQGLLESVGVKAYLTRETDSNPTKVERVKVAEANRSEVFVSVAHKSGTRNGAMIGRYPTSSGGAHLAQSLRREIKASLGYEAPISDNAAYVIQQTSCPAAQVLFLVPPPGKSTATLSDPYEIWKRAYSIFCGILGYLGVGAEPDRVFAVSGVVTERGKPCGGAIVVLDGTLEAPTDANGRFSLRLLERGRHTATVLSRSGKARSIQVDEKAPSLVVSLD